MAIWKKQLHIALVFILVLSLFSPASVIKAQHFEGETGALNSENAHNINEHHLDDSTEQDNTTEPDNEKKLEDSTEQDHAFELAELEQPMQLNDATITPFMEISPLSVSDIQLNIEEPLLLQVAETFELIATTSTTEDSASIEWTSSNSGVATVDNGLVTAKAIGETIITAKLGTNTKAITAYVISPEAREAIDFILALPPITSADETTYQLLLQARELDSKVKAPARTLLITAGKLPYFTMLLEKEITYFKLYMQDPNNDLPTPEEMTSLSEEVNSKLDTIREKYSTLIKTSGYRKVTDSEILAFNDNLIAKEVKYAYLAINALPKIEELTINTAIKEQLDYARKKYNILPTTYRNNNSVSNKQELFDKEVRYVELLIDAIDIDSTSAKEQLATAKAAYNSLNPKSLQNNVSNYDDLIKKEQIINAEGDINQVITKINALPSLEALVWADRSKVIEAQQAYDQLLDEFKTRVTNYAKLEALQKRLIELQPPTVDAYHAVANYLSSSSAIPTYGSEWTILTLARGDNSDKYKDYYEQYYSNLVKHVKTTNGKIGSQSTDWSRVIIALTAIGKDPRDVGGYNLVEKLTDYNFAISPGINSAVYSLIALDTWAFDLPETATTTRDKLIDYILSKEIKGVGGFALSGTNDDADVTGMTLQALAPYYQSNTKVQEVINRAIDKLVTMQLPNGAYKSADYSVVKGVENPESAAQVVTALVSLGIDVNKDERFNKVISNIMTYQSDDGGFKHSYSQNKANGMATVQVGYSLAAYNRLLSNQTALYDMSDTKDQPSTPEDGDGDDDEEPSPPDNNGNQPSVPSEKEPIGYATVSIRISSSEVPLKPTATKVFAGETAFDALKRATDENGIALSYRQTELGVYIDGIAGLYEFDRGPLSGWMYRVNGSFPSYSAASYVLSPNDVVEWVYTIDLGKDTGGYVDGIENGAGGAAGDAICAEGDTECIAKLCPEGDEQCIAEHTVPKPDTEQPQNKTVVEITIEGNENKALITQENLQEYREKNIQKLIIQSNDNFKLEIPMSTFNTMTLADGEQISASVTKDVDNKQFTVSFGIETAQGRVKPISLGNEYLKVTLPAKDVKANSVVLQLVGGEHKSVPHKIVNGEIVVFTKTSGTFVIAERSATFNDIAHLANKDEIEFLANRLVIQGTTPETFEPNKPITRAQFAALISRSLGLQSTGENPFSDTQGKWYESDIQALFEAGITKGTTASTFNPEAPITRQQAAAFMARILDYVKADVTANGQVDFTDSRNISAEYLPYIDLLNSLDIMTGKEDGSFDPGASLTRGQTAKILKRTLTIANMM